MPYLLIGIRLTITFFALLDAIDGILGRWFVVGFCTAVLLDFLDGMLARRLNVETQHIRRVDSIADFVMVIVYLLIGGIVHREYLTPYIPVVMPMLGFTILASVIARLKFQRVPPLHTNLTRLTGIVLFLAAIELFLRAHVGILFKAGLVIGFLSQVDRIAITLTLPCYPEGDIRSLFHALKIRKENLSVQRLSQEYR